MIADSEAWFFKYWATIFWILGVIIVIGDSNKFAKDHDHDESLMMKSKW